MSLRIVLRWAAAGAPFSWFGFATRFKASREFVAQISSRDLHTASMGRK
jgi:hypothetical protein